MSSTEKSVILVFTVAINVTFKLSGDEFFYDVNLKNNGDIRKTFITDHSMVTGQKQSD